MCVIVYEPKSPLPGKVVCVDGQTEVNKTLQEPHERGEEKNNPHPWAPVVFGQLLQGKLAVGRHGGTLLQIVGIQPFISLK